MARNHNDLEAQHLHEVKGFAAKTTADAGKVLRANGASPISEIARHECGYVKGERSVYDALDVSIDFGTAGVKYLWVSYQNIRSVQIFAWPTSGAYASGSPDAVTVQVGGSVAQVILPVSVITNQLVTLSLPIYGVNNAPGSLITLSSNGSSGSHPSWSVVLLGIGDGN